MQKGIRFSLKYKLLLVLTGLPLISLSLYLYLATKLFEKDKLAYVYDSSATLSRTVAAQVQSTLTSFTDALLPIVTQYDPIAEKFKEEANTLFNQQKKLVYVSFYKGYSRATYLSKDDRITKTMDAMPEQIKSLITSALSAGVAVLPLGTEVGHFIMAVSDQKKLESYPQPNADAATVKNSKKEMIVIVGSAPSLQDVIDSSSTFQNYLINYQGSVFMHSSETQLLDKLVFFSEKKWSDVPEGTAEYTMDKKPVIAAFSKVGIADLKVVSIIDKTQAFAAGRELLIKSIYCLVVIFSANIILSIFASSGLTSKLLDLYQASQKVSDGQFDVQLTVKSNDEVGGLTESFNHMAKEVSRLLNESVEKARMANELETAKMVQETLFPPRTAQFTNIEISGFYQPASECGGDWWYYCEIGKYVFVWIGDATGHGAAAALVTSAARSAASIIEHFTDITPSQALSLINNAIYSTSKGKMMMTFFIAAIDKESGEMSYANASHEPPFLLRAKRPIEKSDLEILNGSNGPRLGDTFNITYNEAKSQLQSGDIIVFYTDGLPELKNAEGKNFGERRYVKTLMESCEIHDLNKMTDMVYSRIEDFRSKQDLADDITYFAVKFQKTA